MPALLRSAWCAAAEAQGAQAVLVPLLRPPEPFAPGRCSTADAAAATAEGGERAAAGELPPVLGFGARRRVARVRHAPAEHSPAEAGEDTTGGYHPHESPLSMLIPLGVLSALAADEVVESSGFQ